MTQGKKRKEKKFKRWRKK